ncbi:MAG: S1 family peptidase [Myxococcales bacterium]|nr:S1 family peptidase [Myxococcales bacterium]
MRALALALAALVGCAQRPGEHADPSFRRDAILGGTSDFADPEVFMIEMSYDGGASLCTSTLVGRRTLLTAAHCLQPEAGRLPRVRATNLTAARDAGDSDFISSSKVRPHPGYTSGGSFANDIGLVLLDRAPTVRFKPWNRDSVSGLQRQPARLVGYGQTSAGGRDWGTKRSVDISFNVVGEEVVYGTVETTGTCQGDSGGPAIHPWNGGEERVVAITSFGPEGCGRGSSERVDRHKAFIDQWFAENEDPQCTADAQCKQGCSPADPDCLCLADGACGSCQSPGTDPDCPESCVQNQVCSVSACADPDCQPFGSPCGFDEQCQTRRCVADPQQPSYCSKTCTTAAECGSEMECSQGVCTKRQLPVAALGESCTPGQTFCASPWAVCTGRTGEETFCRRRCLVTSDCTPGECAEDASGLRFCLPAVMVKKMGSTYDAAPGCAALPVPSGALGVLGAWLLVLLRRRCRVEPRKPGRRRS